MLQSFHSLKKTQYMKRILQENEISTGLVNLNKPFKSYIVFHKYFLVQYLNDGLRGSFAMTCLDTEKLI